MLLTTRAQVLGFGTSSSSASGAAPVDSVTTSASDAAMIPLALSNCVRGTKRDSREGARRNDNDGCRRARWNFCPSGKVGSGSSLRGASYGYQWGLDNFAQLFKPGIVAKDESLFSLTYCWSRTTS